MSRIGKQPISIPQGVKVTVSGDQISVEGPKGKLSRTMDPNIAVKVEDGNIACTLKEGAPSSARSKFGLGRSLVANMVEGCAKGFVKKLDIVGVGYRANVKGKEIELALGFSHPVVHSIPDGITVTVEKQTKVTIEGADKQLVGQVAAEIRSYREPEPYKGKGVKYSDEQIIRKAGKSAAGGA